MFVCPHKQKTMKKRLYLLLIAFMTAVAAQTQDFYFKHINVADGLSQSSVLSIYQDELGAVWLGTTEGLNRYNGTRVQTFRPSQNGTGLTNNEINELCGNGEGMLFIRSERDLVAFDLNRERFTCLRTADVSGLFYAHRKLWVACEDKIYSYSERNGEWKLFATLPKGSTGATALYVDSQTVWVLTGKRLLAYTLGGQLQEQFGDFSNARCLYKDRKGELWIGTWNGLYRLSAERQLACFTHQLGQNSLSDNQVRCILEDDYHQIWVGTFRGLDCYHTETGLWKNYTRYSAASNTLSHNSIFALHQDRQGHIWVGTYFGGANVFNPNSHYNRFYYAEPEQPTCLSFPFVGKMTEDESGNLFICTEGGGLNRFDPHTKSFHRYLNEPKKTNSLGNNNLKSIFYRQENHSLYIGTHTGGLSILNLQTGRIKTIYPTEPTLSSKASRIVNDIQPYLQDLILLTQDGVFRLDPRREVFSRLTATPEIQALLNCSYTYETLLIDRRNRLWLALSKGGVVCVDLIRNTHRTYLPNTPTGRGIGKFKVAQIFENADGALYFCTLGSGLFRYQDATDTFRAYTAEKGALPSNYCYYLCAATTPKRLYLIHSQGFSVFNHQQGKVEQTYTLFGQHYNQGSSIFVSQSGSIYVGGVNGLAVIKEEYLNQHPSSQPLRFDKLYLFNREVHPNDSTRILSQILAHTPAIDLTHQQNNLAIEFASFNYHDDKNVIFEYKLENFDQAWTQTQEHTIAYTSLKPGDYTLRLRQLDSQQLAGPEATLHIHVSAPFYATIWAYLLYSALVVGLILFFVRFKIRQSALQASLRLERQEKVQLEALNQAKLSFFTNISHEFRTPLTLILGQIELLLLSNKLHTTAYNRLLKVYYQANQLRELVTELLNFRKLEQGYLKLTVTKQDFVALTKTVYADFYDYAQKKEITYLLDVPTEEMPLFFDRIQLQKVLSNLLSNAFKHTPKQGTITLRLRQTATDALLEVEDSGRGIPAQDLENIFERFYQAHNTASDLTPGIGIGLALSKEIVDRHHGQLCVTSQVGQGSLFTLCLPLGSAHFSGEELQDDQATGELSETLTERPFKEEGATMTDEKAEANGALWEPKEGLKWELKEEEDNAPEGGCTTDENKPVLLIIEDHDELITLLAELFEPFYEIHRACNGREGLDLAYAIQPDLILSDVMMPEMSGKELCYKLKNSVELAHIPVVLLTAQTSADQMMEGYLFGADDYVTKPFNSKILVARCNNLLANKKRLRAYYAGRPVIDTVKADATSQRDKEFLDKCSAIIKAHFDNPNFDVTTLASELCMGRSKLYMAFKQLMGLTPNEFILKTKLDEAKALLNSRPDLNIADISVMLGFSSPRYFSKCFKAFFGMPPQELRKRLEDATS